MRRPQFTLKTLLWLMAMAAGLCWAFTYASVGPAIALGFIAVLQFIQELDGHSP